MNIDDNFNNAEALLKMAKDNIAAHDYDSTLTSLAEAYAHIRELVELVYKLQGLKTEVEGPAGKE